MKNENNKTPQTYDWCNNTVLEHFNRFYPNDFSICDGDGLIRKDYVSGSRPYTRLVYLEIKHAREKLRKPQEITLRTLAQIDWQKQYDEFSGVFLLRHQLEAFPSSSLTVYKVTPDSIDQIGMMTMDELYAWLSAKDKTIYNTCQ